MDVFAAAIRLQARAYQLIGVQMAFTHPKTLVPAELKVIYSSKPHQSEGLAVQVGAERPTCRVRLADLTALGLKPTDFDGLPITVQGDAWRINSSAAMPGSINVIAEIAFSLIRPRPT